MVKGRKEKSIEVVKARNAMNLLHSPSFPCFRDAIAILVNDGNLPERKKPAGEGDVRPDFGELVSD